MIATSLKKSFIWICNFYFTETTLSHLYVVIRQTVRIKMFHVRDKQHKFYLRLSIRYQIAQLEVAIRDVEIGRKAAMCLRSVISNPEQFFSSVSWVYRQKVRRMVTASFERRISMDSSQLHACYFRRVYGRSIELIWGKDRIIILNQI